MTFGKAMERLPALRALGISHIYLSPIFTAAPGSMHGYNVVDYGHINPEIGTREDFDRMVSTLHQHGMGLIIDFVPKASEGRPRSSRRPSPATTRPRWW